MIPILSATTFSSIAARLYKATDNSDVKKPKKKPTIKPKPKKPKDISPRIIIHKLIMKRKKGMSAAELFEKTDLTKSQIQNAIYHLKKKGMITAVSKGHYQATS